MNINMPIGDGGGASPTPLRTDAMKAAEYRTQLQQLLNEVVATLNQAEREGLLILFSIGRDGFGRQAVTSLTVAKVL